MSISTTLLPLITPLNSSGVSSTYHIPQEASTFIMLISVSIISTIDPFPHSPSSLSFPSNWSSAQKVSRGTSKVEPAIRIVWLVLGPIIFLVGVCGNFFVLIIMTRRIMGGTSTCVHLSVMAVADLTVTLIGLTPEWFEICFHTAFKEIHPATCKIEKFFFYTAADVSVWILVIFTLDRFVAVCYPLRKKSICTTARARLFAATAIIIATSKNAHVFWTRGIQHKRDKSTNQFVIHKLCGTTHPSYEYFESYVRSWIVFIFVNGLPVLMISICNFFIVKTMFSTSKKSQFANMHFGVSSPVTTVAEARSKPEDRSLIEENKLYNVQRKNADLKQSLIASSIKSIDSNSSLSTLNHPRHSISEPFEHHLQSPSKNFTENRSLSHPVPSHIVSKCQQQSTLKTLTVSSTQPINNKALVQMTAMCLSASICFLVCNTPSVILYVGREYWEKNEGYYVFKPLYNIFVYVNHAANFLLYCLTGQRFRRVFVDFFCRGGIHKKRFMSARRYSDWGDVTQNSVNLPSNRQGFQDLVDLKGRRALSISGEKRTSIFTRRHTSVATKNLMGHIQETV